MPATSPAAILIAVYRELGDDEKATIKWLKKVHRAEARLAATPARTLADLREKAEAVIETLSECDRELVLSLARDVAAYAAAA